jgi:hypothetical protein
VRRAQIHQLGCEAAALRRGRVLFLAPSPPDFDPASISSSDDEAEEGRVIFPEDYVKGEAEEARVLADALAASAEAAAAEKKAEEAEHRAALQAVVAAHALLPPPPGLVRRLF